MNAVRPTFGIQLTIEKYTQMVAPLDMRDLDMRDLDMRDLDLANAFHLHPLDPDLPVTSARRDPEITTLLTFWSFQEY